MNQVSQTETTSAVLGAGVIAPVMLALLFGAFLLLGVGFAQPDALHNATHDVRHAIGFPCH